MPLFLFNLKNQAIVFFFFFFFFLKKALKYIQTKITVKFSGEGNKFSVVRKIGNHAEILTSMNFRFKIHT